MDEPSVSVVVSNSRWAVVEVALGKSEAVEHVVDVAVVAVDKKLVPVVCDARSSVAVAMSRCLDLGSFAAFGLTVVKPGSFYSFKETLVGIVSAKHFKNLSFAENSGDVSKVSGLNRGCPSSGSNAGACQ
ncbi:hypothetical protein ACN4BK_09845 [Corynebacterium macclintockiae]|uniref:hypothetical protein n=1 Tax=Corynebacterium macclintockiae TaxID=2913501 RepID=UPI003EBF3420